MASILLLKKCQNGWVYDPDGVVLFQYQFLTGVVLVFQRGEVLFKSGGCIQADTVSNNQSLTC